MTITLPGPGAWWHSGTRGASTHGGTNHTMKTVTRTGDDPVAVPPPDDELVMTMLQEHVPLALVCDLTEPSGPTSQEILDTEGEPADRWWE